LFRNNRFFQASVGKANAEEAELRKKITTVEEQAKALADNLKGSRELGSPRINRIAGRVVPSPPFFGKQRNCLLSQRRSR
jgi:hypothetical protein